MLRSVDRLGLRGLALLGNRSIVWGTASVFGEVVLWDTDLREHSIVWGTDSLAGVNILWITNGVIPSKHFLGKQRSLGHGADR